MAAIGPTIGPDTGTRRPMICIGNGGHTTADRETAERLAVCFREAYDLPFEEVTINQPFSGGYIVRRHGNRPLPWIQIEMSRALYLAEPWFDEEQLSVDPARSGFLRDCFGRALALFFRVIRNQRG
jgi:formiminoglutamase